MTDIEAEIELLRALAGERTNERATAETRLAQARGRVEALRGELSEFGVSTVEQAREKAGRIEQALEAEVTRVRGLLRQAGGEQP